MQFQINPISPKCNFPKTIATSKAWGPSVHTWRRQCQAAKEQKSFRDVAQGRVLFSLQCLIRWSKVNFSSRGSKLINPIFVKHDLLTLIFCRICNICINRCPLQQFLYNLKGSVVLKLSLSSAASDQTQQVCPGHDP